MKFAEQYGKWAMTKNFSTMLTILPHFLSCFILALIFSQPTTNIIGIFFVGMIIPDYALYEYGVLKLFNSKKTIGEELKRKTIAHYLTFTLSLFLVFFGFWEIALAGFIHLILDYIGF